MDSGKLKAILLTIPRSSYNLLKYLCGHLHRVAQYSGMGQYICVHYNIIDADVRPPKHTQHLFKIILVYICTHTHTCTYETFFSVKITDENKMTNVSLSIVFGPNVLR